MKFLNRIINVFVFLLLISYPNVSYALDTKQQESNIDPDHYALLLIDSVSYYASQDINLAYSFINKALDISGSVQDSTKVIIYVNVSKICYSYELYNLSLDCLFKALEIKDKIKDDDPLGYVELYYMSGNSYYRMGDKENSRLYYQKAIKIIEENKETFNKNRFNYMIVYITYSFIEREEKNYANAKELNFKTLNYAEAKKDTLIYIRALRNLSHISFDMHDTVKGMEHLEKAIELAEKATLKTDIAILYNDMGIVLYNIDSVRYAKEAIKFYMKSYENAGMAKEQLSVLKSSTYNLYKIYKSIGDYKNALYFNEISQKLIEESASADLERQITAIRLESMHDENIKQLKTKQDRIFWVSFIIISFFCGIALLFFVQYRYQKEKVAKRKLQNEILQEQLNFKNKEFTSKAMQILQINKILDKINTEIKDIIKDAPEEINKKLLAVVKDIKANKNNLNWEEFEKLFIETNDDFYKNLTADFPDLTKNELRLCAFLKMNLTTKEISAITNQREQSITMARWRLRKKLNLEENASITNFLMKYGGEVRMC